MIPRYILTIYMLLLLFSVLTPTPISTLPMLTAVTLCVVFGCLEAGAALTIYGPTGQIPTPVISASSASSAASATATLGAYNDIVLNAPPIPSPAPPTQFDVVLQNSAQDVPGISIPHSGDFYGFSIEMSVIDQLSMLNLLQL